MAYAEYVTTLGALASSVPASGSSFTLTLDTGSAQTNVALPFGIRSLSSRTGFVRVYDPTLGAGNPAANANAANLPQISSSAQIKAYTQYDDAAPWYKQGGAPASNGAWSEAPDAAGSPQQGMIAIFPQVPAVDVANAASVQTYKSDADTLVVIATGTNVS